MLDPYFVKCFIISAFAVYSLVEDGCFALDVFFCSRADPEGKGGRGSGPPEKSQKLIGFHSNTGPDPLKKHKATKPAFNFGPSLARQSNAI